MTAITGDRFLRFLRRWLPHLVLGPILAGLAGYFVVSQIPSTYQAVATLMVQPADTGGNGSLAPDLQAAQSLAQTYTEAIHTRRILSEAAAQVGLGSLDERDLEARVQVRRVTGTELLRISADDTDPVRAADLVNAVAQVFVNQNTDFQASRYASSRDNLSRLVTQMQADIDARQAAVSDLLNQPPTPERDAQLAQLQSNLNQLRTTYGNTVNSYEALRVSEARSTNTVIVFDAAVPPDYAVRPNRSLTVLLGALAGFGAALGLATVAELADDRLRDARGITGTTGLPTLGVVPKGGRHSAGSHGQLRSPVSESYRVLGSRLTFALRNVEARSLLIASASPAEGKSTVAANLATVFAEAGQRVILIDADMHRPSQMRLFELDNNSGLSTLLLDETLSAEMFLWPTNVPNLRVIPAGPTPADPAALFSSKRLQVVLDQLSSICDLLVVDTPSLLASPDGVLLSPKVDAVVFIVQAQRSRAREAARAVDVLHSSGARVLGVVVNRAGNHWLEYVPSDTSREIPAVVRAESGEHDSIDNRQVEKPRVRA